MAHRRGPHCGMLKYFLTFFLLAGYSVFHIGDCRVDVHCTIYGITYLIDQWCNWLLDM